MKLRPWRIRAGISLTEVARRLKKSRQAIYDYESDKYIPDPEVLLEIEEMSDGAVTIGDWCQGWYDKYTVTKVDGPVDPAADYFVLRLDTDPAARVAALAYASVCPDRKLAAYLWSRVRAYMAPELDRERDTA